MLHCKYPKVLNIYSAVYGRPLEEEDYCPSEIGEPPPFGELLNISDVNSEWIFYGSR